LYLPYLRVFCLVFLLFFFFFCMVIASVLEAMKDYYLFVPYWCKGLWPVTYVYDVWKIVSRCLTVKCLLIIRQEYHLYGRITSPRNKECRLQTFASSTQRKVVGRVCRVICYIYFKNRPTRSKIHARDSRNNSKIDVLCKMIHKNL
jgi:hypothetical protein